MKYKSIEIKNFKGIKDVTIDFTNNRILTIVGLNESGKTTILEAIHTFYKLIKGTRLKSNELNQIRPKGIDFTGKIEIKANLEFEANDYEKLRAFLKNDKSNPEVNFPKEFAYSFAFEYKLHKYVNETRTCWFEIKNKHTKKVIVEEKNELWQDLIKEIKSELIPDILYYEDFIFQIPEEISFPITEDAISSYINNDHETEEWKLVLDDILKSASSNLTSFQEHIASIWFEDNDTARQRINAMEAVLDRVITRAWKELFEDEQKKIMKSVKKLNFKEIKIICNSQNDFLHITFKVKTESGKEFSINERSKGFKWFFSFLIFTEFRKKRTRNIMFLLDEPASNLHSSAQAKILNAIQQLSDESIILYSTHSHHMINPEWLTGAYVVVNESVSEENLEGALTDIDAKISIDKYFNFVSKSKTASLQLYYQPILDVLEYKPSLMETVKNIVICEGKNDWYTFNYMSKYILKDKYNYNFYPGAGRDNQFGIIRLYLSWGASFLMVLDGDAPSQKSQKKYLSEFDGFVENRIFTFKDILGLECPTENLFEESDHKAICDEAFGKGTYDVVKNNPKQLKSKFNFAIVQLLNSKKSVEISETAKENFRGVLSFCKAKATNKAGV